MPLHSHQAREDAGAVRPPRFGGVTIRQQEKIPRGWKVCGAKTKKNAGTISRRNQLKPCENDSASGNTHAPASPS
jgi:hypothetical protein